MIAALGLGEGVGLGVAEPPVPEPPVPLPPPAGLLPMVAPPLPHATSEAIPIARVKSIIESRTLNTHDRFDEPARERRAEAGGFVETGTGALRARCEDARGIGVWTALGL